MGRLLTKVSALFVLAVYVGFLVPSTIQSDGTSLQSSAAYTTYSYLNTASSPLLSATNEVSASPVPPTLAISESVDRRLVGMLLHLKWLSNQKGDLDGVSKTLFDKQISSMMDDFDDDIDDLRDELLVSSEFSGSVLTAPVFSGPIASNFALGTYYLSGDGDNEGIAIDSAGNVQLTAALRDTSGDFGTSGFVLLSTGGGTNWVSTSSLGIDGTLSDDSITPDYVATSGQTDEYCLTYEVTGDTWEWQSCGFGYLAAADIDTSSELAAILTDETGTGRSVFSISPAFSGTPTFASLTATSTLTLSGTAANIALGSNYLSGDGGDEGIFVDGSGNVGLGTTTPLGKLSVAGTTTPTGSYRDFGVNYFTQEYHSAIFSALNGASYTNGFINTSIDTNVDITNSDAESYGISSTLRVTGSDSDNFSYNAAASFAGEYEAALNNTSNTILGANVNAYNSSGYTLGTAYGGRFAVTNTNTNSTIIDAVGVLGDIRQFLATNSMTSASLFKGMMYNGLGTMTSAYGLNIANLTNTGTVGNTYGVYVGDITAGTQTNQAYSVYASDANTRNYFAGNVGIGTTTPNQILTVQGNLNLSAANGSIYFDDTKYLYASTTNDSLVFGENAGATFNSGTTNNIAIGLNAGRYASTTDDSIYIGAGAGTNNTGWDSHLFGVDAGANNSGYSTNAMGYGAGYNNTNSDNNFFGYNAGYSNIGESGNFFGNSAGYNNTGLYNNNLFGYGAGYNNAGDENNIFGQNTGYNNTGSYANLFGENAGRNNIGSYNNFIGGSAGYNNTGNYNDFIGYQTGRYLKSTSTVAIGTEALYGGSTYESLNNVALGYRAGYASANGSGNNILLGYRAADNLTTGNNNIIIGYDIDSVTATADNNLNIGNLIFGTGLDGTGTTLASGNIGIGTTSPSAKLTVQNTGSGKSFIVEDQAVDTTPFVIDANGNVGIGTTTPTAKLDVQGSAEFGTTNIALITSAGKITGLSSTYFGTDTSANLASILTDETGTGVAVFSTSPTLTTPNLGTPSAITLTSGTGLPISTGLTGAGTGVLTALGVNVGSAGAFVVNGGVLGTPSSGTLTNATGLPISTGVSGLGTNVATFLATPSSANLFGALTDETGALTSGALAVFSISPVITGTADFQAGDFSSTLTLSGTAANIALGSNYLSGDGGDEGVFVDSTGNVGLGTTTPANKFEVYNGFVRFTETGGSSGATADSWASNLVLDTSGNSVGMALLSSNTGAAQIAFGDPQDANIGYIEYSHVSNSMAFRTNASDKLTILSTGNTGIGTSTPTALLDVQGSAEFGTTNVALITSAGKITGLSSTYFGTDTSANLATILTNETGTGNTVFSASPTFTGTLTAADIDLSGTLNLAGASYISSLGYARLENGIVGAPAYSFQNDFDTGLWTPVTDVLAVSTGGVERFRVNAVGNLGIGTTTPAQKLQVFGNIRVGTTGSNGCLEDFSGGLIAGTCSSDENLKENIEPIAQEGRSYLESLAALTPVTYNWNEVAGDLYSKDTSVENLGLIAQDVETQFPELVSRNDDGYKQVDFRALPFYIIEALKELWSKVQGQDERLEQLEQENDYLKERIETIEDELNIEATPEIVVEEDAVLTEEPSEEVPIPDVLEEVVEPEPIVEELVEEPTYVLVPAESL